jgi:hypothetical protein
MATLLQDNKLHRGRVGDAYTPPVEVGFAKNKSGIALWGYAKKLLPGNSRSDLKPIGGNHGNSSLSYSGSTADWT